MYLVLVEEFVNQWISSVNARFVMLDPLGSKFPQYVMSLRFESVSLLSSSWPVLCDVPRPCRGVVGPMDFFLKNRGGGSRIASLSPPVVVEAHQGCFHIPLRGVVTG